MVISPYSAGLFPSIYNDRLGADFDPNLVDLLRWRSDAPAEWDWKESLPIYVNGLDLWDQSI